MDDRSPISTISLYPQFHRYDMKKKKIKYGLHKIGYETFHI
jgi:hypothetical protein